MTQLPKKNGHPPHLFCLCPGENFEATALGCRKRIAEWVEAEETEPLLYRGPHLPRKNGRTTERLQRPGPPRVAVAEMEVGGWR